MFYMPKSHLLIHKDNLRLACKMLPYAEQGLANISHMFRNDGVACFSHASGTTLKSMG